jgi:intraflagellar transport protein 20
VEKEKMSVLGAQNRLKSATKAREQQQQQLHALIVERKMALERLRLETEALQKVEAEQTEFIEQGRDSPIFLQVFYLFSIFFLNRF